MIEIVRIDERLIHGQIVTGWLNSYNISEILVINDQVSKDDFRKSLMEMAVPEKFKLMFLSIPEALKIFDEENKYENLFVLFSNPNDLYTFVKANKEVNTVNIGGMSKKKGRELVTTSVYASSEEIEVFKEILSLGIKLEARMLPTDKSLDLSKLI